MHFHSELDFNAHVNQRQTSTLYRRPTALHAWTDAGRRGPTRLQTNGKTYAFLDPTTLYNIKDGNDDIRVDYIKRTLEEIDNMIITKEMKNNLYKKKQQIGIDSIDQFSYNNIGKNICG